MTARYTCVIVDDEPKAIEMLADSITALYQNIEIIRTHSTWKEALDTIRNEDFDLLFMDMSMPQKTGMDILDLVPELNAELIFVTAYSDYAIDAFQYGATGYILKPIKDVALSQAIDTAIKRIEQKRRSAQAQPATHITSKIAIPNSSGIDYVDVHDIVFLEATARYTKLVLKNKEILSSYNIGKFKQLLSKHPFFPIHRSYIVNLDCITQYKSIGTVVMSQGQEIPVAKNTRDEFLNLFMKVTRDS